ncbi:MAG: hypothetical protein A2W01_03035 [Candidatus Solincola sediminis]|nr:MAG: hypothetical protein A2W01_03035 [Candidatus Solincola sediminis]
MKGAVVFYSRWGNGKQVAEQIAKGLEQSGHEVELINLKISQGSPADGFEFLVAGSPTRAQKMASPLKRFIKGLDNSWKGKPFAAYGTGYKKWLETSTLSSDSIHQELEEFGLKPLAKPLRIGVNHTRGPLSEGEPQKALEFGKDVGAILKSL